MRRQARISGGGALLLRTASALQVWLWLLIFVFQNEFRISRSIQPGYLDFDNLPDTNFTCAGKVIGGYYADLETSCQMFHVCTVGQQEEPMDIKFLCLNGTVFDQETRVCERVDEVDCTKSETFYSLNLELYGSTAPPIIQPEQIKPSTKPTEHAKKPNPNEDNDPTIDGSQKPLNGNSNNQGGDVIDSTEEPPHSISQDGVHKIPDGYLPAHPTVSEHIPHHVEPVEENQEEEEENSEIPEYDDEYPSISPSTTAPPVTTFSPPTTTIRTTPAPSRPPPASPSPAPVIPTHMSSLQLPVRPASAPAPATGTSLDPSLLSPQEFIYHNRGPGVEAISFQRQGFRPADGVYITHAPPQQFDHFQYESSRTAPRPIVSRPAPFAQRPPPSPFRVTTSDPRDQLLRPGPSSQPSERHETTIKHRQPYPSLSALPAQRPLPFDPFYFDRKRSDDSGQNTEPSLTARSAIPPTINERPPTKPKSPPRVIVTASASVSDSNGKRLNYTVGNVVSAVKPIVQINYDDYKESDLIFDPFFLDVPKLQKRRKTRANKNKLVTVPATTISLEISRVTSTTVAPATPTVTTPATELSKPSTTVTTTTSWNPNDYVDDNYEPHAFLPPAPPIAYLFPLHDVKHNQYHNKYVDVKMNQNEKVKVRRTEQIKPVLPAVRTQISSSQSPAVASTATLPTASSACAQPHSQDCRSRA